MQNKLKLFRPVIILFILLNAIFLTTTSLSARWEIDKEVLIIGNMVLFFASLISFFVAIRGLRTENPHAFVRSVYSSIMLKFFICVLAALIYIMSFRKGLNKPALFICMGLYLVYTFVEISVLTKYLRKLPNAKERSAY